MTIGKQLRQAREARNLSLEQVAYATRIRVRYLQALEAEQFDVLPSSAQVRGFLRAYAAQLKLDPAPLLAALDGESPPPPVVEQSTPAVEELPASSHQAIFAEIGATLQRQRELIGLSLDDVERHTHIRIHYIRALEAGNLDGLPSPVQGKGMLNNYAEFLGLDAETLLLRFADGLQARLAAHQPERTAPRPIDPAAPSAGFSTLRRLFSPDFIIGGLVALFLIGFIIWGALRVSALRSAQLSTPTVMAMLPETASSAITPTPTRALATDAGTPAGTLVDETPTNLIPQETQEATPGIAAATPTPDFGSAPVQVYVVVHQRAWMRVTVDGEVAYEGRAIPGSAYPFAAEARIELVTGNGAGLQVFFNQQDLGLLGLFGEVVQRVFTVQGVLAPTPAVPPTATPGPTGTPTPTGTPGATPTPTP